MNKRCLVMTLACCSMISAGAQTLFTYGKYKADAKEFLHAFNKNNTQPVTNKAKAISDYLDLFVKSRLKIREAYERRYDTLPQIKNEVNSLRTQIVENYMNDPETVTRLSREAFQRSQLDIHCAHIFISLKTANGIIDTLAARRKTDEILNRLQKGEDFFKVAEQESDDPSARDNKGDMGFITVFTLPYEFENIIYTTPTGKYSGAYHSKIGYHIFKNLGERKALGRIRAQQILLAYPPDADEAMKNEIAARADSIYKRILAGGDFSKLASIYSNDYISAASGGLMQDIIVGQYDPLFESMLWSLSADSAVSKPFMTSHGWHIVKRISVKPVVTDSADRVNQQELQQKIAADGRSRLTREFIYDRVIKKAGFKKYNYPEASLWAYSDSLLDSKPGLGSGKIINSKTSLFKVADTVIYATDWISYAQTFRYRSDGTGANPYPQVMEEFIHKVLFDYYRDHLEFFNEEFRSQMQEFLDGNLFFEIMQQEIWNKAQADSAALVSLYEKNKKKYNWQQSADAVIFFCSDPDASHLIYDKLKQNPAGWRKITEAESEKVVADSARYEWSQLPNLNNKIPVAGDITTPLVNKNDNTASFAYIVKVYQQTMPRTFNEARGLVISDYQALLEDQWIARLKKKYPVLINKKVLAGVSK